MECAEECGHTLEKGEQPAGSDELERERCRKNSIDNFAAPTTMKHETRCFRNFEIQLGRVWNTYSNMFHVGRPGRQQTHSPR